jgi:uncharacterized protein
VAVLLDTGVLYALYDQKDLWHSASRKLVEEGSWPLIVPTPVIPEVDYLLGERLGSRAQTIFYQGLADGSFLIADLPIESYPRILELNQKYPKLRLGFVDAAVLTMAENLGLSRIATTDRRHFQAVKLAFEIELVPAGPHPG